jgi:hypothetical protein
MVSELQAAAALPINTTRAIRDTAAQCPEHTRNRMTKTPTERNSMERLKACSG